MRTFDKKPINKQQIIDEYRQGKKVIDLVTDHQICTATLYKIVRCESEHKPRKPTRTKVTELVVFCLDRFPELTCTQIADLTKTQRSYVYTIKTLFGYEAHKKFGRKKIDREINNVAKYKRAIADFLENTSNPKSSNRSYSADNGRSPLVHI